MSNRNPQRRRPAPLLEIPAGEGLPAPLQPIPRMEHERVRQTFRAARDLVPRGLTPIARFFATRDLFRGQP